MDKVPHTEKGPEVEIGPLYDVFNRPGSPWCPPSASALSRVEQPSELCRWDDTRSASPPAYLPPFNLFTQFFFLNAPSSRLLPITIGTRLLIT